MPFRTPVECSTTEQRRTRDELDHINTRFVYNMSPAYFQDQQCRIRYECDKQRKMVNSKLGEEMTNDN